LNLANKCNNTFLSREHFADGSKISSNVLKASRYNRTPSYQLQFIIILTLGGSKLKSSLEAPKPIFRLGFKRLYSDNHISEKSLGSSFENQKAQKFQ
jgi:hypothetical protein